jgi:hypothetical protein
MANTIFNWSAAAFKPDTNAQLVAGDLGAEYREYEDRSGYVFDDVDEAAMIGPEAPMPQGVVGTLIAKVHFFMLANNSDDIALDIFVEAKTPGVDTIDMETAASWDSANSGTMSLSGSTAGDPLVLSITLTNKDGVVAGDLTRIGVRRDCDSANDDAADELVITAVEIQES